VVNSCEQAVVALLNPAYYIMKGETVEQQNEHNRIVSKTPLKRKPVCASVAWFSI